MVSLQEWENRINELIASKNKSDGERLRQGVEFAKMAHEGAYRKSTHEPYIVHPLEVSLVASTVTDDVDILIAALLHDVVEDTEYTIDAIKDKFGSRVAGFVSDESEDKMENIPKAISWMIRKEKFLVHLRKAQIGSKIICMSDKISNLRSTYGIYQNEGNAMWSAFNQKDPRRHAWYYRSIAEVLMDDFEGTDAFKEYCELFTRIFGSVIRVYKSENGGLIMKINELKIEDNSVHVSISGRVTSSNADEMFEAAKSIINENPNMKMIYDLDDLDMISSAGLRVFLKIKKLGIDFKIINASSQVYEVFEMTGFSQMFDISKAYRKFDLSGCTVIGEGAKGIVYRVDDETICKVYKNNDALNEIINERECAKKALVMGIPTAIAFDIVRVGEKFGSVFELVNADSLTNELINKPDRTKELIDTYASIMHEVHDLVDTGDYGIEFPSIKEDVIKWADFTKDYVDVEVYNKIKDFAINMKEIRNVLHGDCHPNNVMCTKDELLLIDMDTLCVGDPLVDIAIIYTALVGYKVVEPENDFLPISTDEGERLWSLFIRAYMKECSEDEIEEAEKWCKKFCYLRLFRRGIRKEKNSDFAESAKKELLKAYE